MEPLYDQSQVGSIDPGPLFSARLLKAEANGEGRIKFSGIASHESTDVQGDQILRKHLDLSYANQRGFVNWNHSRDPGLQLGYLTKAVKIGENGNRLSELQKSFPSIDEAATVYVEGELYSHVDKAVEVGKILKSMESERGLGLSLDGSLARSTDDGGIVKAYVRGVAITPEPAQPHTLAKMMKSIEFYSGVDKLGLPTDPIAAIIDGIVARIPGVDLVGFAKSATVEELLDTDAAILYVLKERPKWNFELAKKLVDYTISRQGEV